MPQPNKDKNRIDQANFKARMREQGFRQIQVWVHKDDALELKRIAHEMKEKRKEN